MTDEQKAFALALVNALATDMSTRRDATPEQRALIEKAREKTPKMLVWCEKMAEEVRRRVDSYMLDTWEETARDERGELDDDYEGGWPFVT